MCGLKDPGEGKGNWKIQDNDSSFIYFSSTVYEVSAFISQGLSVMEVYGTQCEDFPSNLQIFSQQIGLDGTRYV